MCGIVGYDGDFSDDLLLRMTRRVTHRGPDDEGFHRPPGRQVALGHRRLSILDTSLLGHQPMLDRLGRISLTFNGEIYNFRELREEIEARGVVFRSRTDTEVLLEGYRAWGDDVLSRLNGIFAFGLWDEERDRLLVARDEAGVKPLYYAELPRGFLFGSEIKALLCEPTLPRDLDPEALECHLVYLWAPAPRTMLKAVRKLQPGTALVVRKGRIVRRIRFGAERMCGAPHRAPTFAEALPQVRETLERAVRRQIVADVPVGAFLSGGLDSSAIVAMARRYSPNLPCFTIDLSRHNLEEDGLTDDLPYARAVARALEVDLHEIPVGPGMTDDLATMVEHLDEPQADPAGLHVRLIAGLARRHGIKVLLSGAGADDLFAGYRRHVALQYESAWSRWPLSLRRAVRGATTLLPGSRGLLRRLRKAFAYADHSADRRIVSYFFWIDPDRVRSLYAPEWGRALADWDCSDPLLKTLEEQPPEWSPLSRMLGLERRHFLADHNLNYTDKMAMACGVEVRVPYLDPDLVGLATRLPDDLRIRSGQGKWILREAVRDLLPSEILSRSKTGFGAPVRAWLRGPLRPLVEDLLGERCLAARGFFQPPAVRALIADDRRGRIDAAYTLLAMVCIELWCRRFLDRPVA